MSEKPDPLPVAVLDPPIPPFLYVIPPPRLDFESNEALAEDLTGWIQKSYRKKMHLLQFPLSGVSCILHDTLPFVVSLPLCALLFPLPSAAVTLANILGKAKAEQQRPLLFFSK